MKKIAALLLAALLLLGAAPALGADQPLNIVCTIFPLYDWARQIVGEDAQVTLLLDSGVDLHNFQPSMTDMLTLKTADVFFYVGGESDEWVESTLSAVGDTPHAALIDWIEAKEEELLPGMEAEEEEEEDALDEHIWLSLINAQQLVAVMRDQLIALRPAYADIWSARAQAYIGELAALEAEYASALRDTPVKTLLFADRFPFRYLADDYGLECFAAFAGCAAQADASFQTIMFLVNTLKDKNLPAILVIEGSDGAIAQTVKSGAKSAAPILTLHSCQSVNAEQVKAGVTYLSLMRDNLSVLLQALGKEGV